MRILTLLLLTALAHFVNAQHPEQKWIEPKDPLVQQELSDWQDLKFGLLMHWGTYSQWGIVESWSLCPEDEGWCERRGPHAKDYFEYRKQYENLQKTFNPIMFDPNRWAKAARNAGMRYMIFTTKHHDGFCMFDTKQTNYKITDPSCPYSTQPKANVTKEIFDAFRKEELWTGAYFSKPDWHCPDYWTPYFPPYDRNPNYKIEKYPERWESYKKFTHAQIEELMRDYGRVDILWLDGGWVQPMTETSPRWGYAPVNQDIEMDKLVNMARKYQPGLIVVDRAVEGPNQNYLTPEQQIPDKPLPFPWETCMTMAGSWSYAPGDQVKPLRTLIHNLARIVSRGGNYLLNIAPGPEGDWDPEAYTRLEEIGAWISMNGNAIYNTRPVEPYELGQMVFTRHKDGTVNGIWLVKEGDNTLPEKIAIDGLPIKPKEVTLIGTQPVTCSILNEGGHSWIVIPKGTALPDAVACVFEMR